MSLGNLSGQSPPAEAWSTGWTAGTGEGGWRGLQGDANSSSVEAALPPEWLVRLDQAATLLMTCNTVTLMLGLGAATYWREFWQHLKRPWACLIGLVCQFALLPAVGFGLSLAFQLPPYEALSVLILTTSPGGAFSNFFTYWVDADLALSIMMTALSCLLAFGMMPLSLWLYLWRLTDHQLQVPYVNILISLAVVTAPVVAGTLVRSHTRRGANYLTKVCGVLGWVGAVACGVLLVLRHWDTIVVSSVYLVLIAALTPLSGFLVSYVLVKSFCFSHKICRTVAIDTGCQNIVVTISITLLSFTDPQVRGHMVLFPVLYGLCQLVEVLVATGIFQAWAFCHRHDVTEENITSVLDTSLLTSVPVPSHKLSQAMIERLMENTRAPIVHLSMQSLTSSSHPHHHHHHHHHHTPGWGSQHSCGEWPCAPEEAQPFLPQTVPTQQPEELFKDSTIHGTPRVGTRHHVGHYASYDPTADFTYGDSINPGADDLMGYAHSYDSDSLHSPALSNKGVLNMFPVTESDFRSDREDSFPSYDIHIPTHRTRSPELAVVEQQWAEGGSGRGSGPPTVSPTPPTGTTPYARPFAFYHRDIRLGQTQQFSTVERK